MKKFFTTLACTIVTSLFVQVNFAQLISGNAYMQGDYVEVAIGYKGHEGADSLWADTTYHFRDTPSGLWGFVANPQMDGWVDYNGDFFTPGTPECGLGLTYDRGGTTYEKSNNYDVNDILGSIIDYTETTDSVLVTWQGMVDSLQMTLLYELKKDELKYTTTVTLTNLGSFTFSNIYFYDNFDPDNNQQISGSYTTTNTLESQSEMADDSVIVSATQDLPWLSEVFLLAEGPDWKAAVGGFSNRNGADIWNGTGFLTGTEGYTVTADQAIAIAHKTELIAPGKTVGESFSYATAFSRSALVGDEDDEDDGETGAGIADLDNLPLRMYPNPATAGELNLKLEGKFTFTILDASGRFIMMDGGNDFVQVDIQDLAEGVYFVQVVQNGAQKIERLVIK